MFINTNISAMNIWRNWQIHNDKMATAIQRISSGSRINSAADDPAGLAVSEKMKAKIRMLQVQQRNTLDEISKTDTVEGHLNEIQSMLNRMTELATQSMNGTYDDLDRRNLNAEYQEYLKEFNRINNSATFNGQNLFQSAGTTSLATAETSVDAENMLTIQGNNLNAYLDSLNTFLDQINIAVRNNDDEAALSLGINLNDDLSNSERLRNAVIQFTKENGQSLLDSPTSDGSSGGSGLYELKIDQSSGNINVKMDVSSKGLGLSDTNLLDPEAAKKALEAVTKASKSISGQRGTYGATRNLLDHTLNRLSEMEVNLTEALSRITDADMAKEIMEYTKQQVLSQACSFLMAQVNHQPDQVIALLKSL